MATSSASSSSLSSNIMLTIFEKKTTSVELYRPLRNYIAFNYSECEAQNLEDDLQTLSSTAPIWSARRDEERRPLYQTHTINEAPAEMQCRDKERRRLEEPWDGERFLKFQMREAWVRTVGWREAFEISDERSLG